MEDLSAVRTLKHVALEPLQLTLGQLRPQTLFTARGALLKSQVVSDVEAVFNSKQHGVVHNAIVSEHFSITFYLLVQKPDLLLRKIDLLQLPGAVKEVDVF